ncbi:recombinase family protein [Streptomyces sp. NPDC001594]|uniref:recombinase family protein n=1 Tax=Streptomyces sp. NPDC001594 TaxID=3364590 RepID=UPI0036C3A852
MPVAPEYLHLIYPGPFPALLYGRASVDPKQKGSSVRAQLHEGHKLCEQVGWPVVDEYKDVGISATRHARQDRDDFERLLDDIRRRRGRIVVAFEASRYYRDLGAYIRLRDACHEADVLLCYNGQVFDLSKREDRKATAQDAVQAEDEGEGIRDRNLRTARLTAEAGKPWGIVPDGYKREYDPDTGVLLRQIEHPVQAPVVRRIWREAAASQSLRSIAAGLNRDGHRTQKGKLWQVWHLRTILRNPAYVGRRKFRGKDFKEGTWPALVESQVFDAVQQLLDVEGRAWATDLTPVHLLSGIGLCGEHFDLRRTNSEPTLRGFVNRGYPSLKCDLSAHVTINERKLVAYTEEHLVTYLASDKAKRAFQVKADDREAEAARVRLRALEAQLEEARVAATTFDENGVPGLSIASLNATELRLTPLIAAARQAARPAVVPEVLLNLLEATDPGALWDGYDLQQQRSVLRLCCTVRLHKASVRGVRSIEEGRVTLAFEGEPGFMGGLRRGQTPPPERDLGQPGGL